VETVSLGLLFVCKFEDTFTDINEKDSKTKMDAVRLIEQWMAKHRLSAHSTSWALKALFASRDLFKEAPSK